MKIVRFYPDWGQPNKNIGDLFVEVGARHILPAARDVTYLIGTPWFWHMCERSEKYRWLDEITANEKGKLVAVAVGASVPLGNGADLLSSPGTVEACKRIWNRFHAISVRDSIAEEFLRGIGIEATVLSCPSLFAAEVLQAVLPTRSEGLLFIDAPASYPQMAEARAKAVVPSDGDVFLYRQKSGTEDTLRGLLEEWARYETIISARIHAALPMAPHRKVAVVPLDSRALTATEAGIPAWPGEPVQLTDLKPVLGAWVKWIKAIIGEDEDDVRHGETGEDGVRATGGDHRGDGARMGIQNKPASRNAAGDKRARRGKPRGDAGRTGAVS